MCENYASAHNITFNVKKTKCMCVKPKSLQDMCVPPIVLNGRVVHVTNEHKYLGCILNDSMKDDNDIKRQLRQVYSKGNSLVHKFKPCTDSVKAELFRMYCGNMYCCTLWANYHNTVFKQLTVAYKSVFRKLFNLTTRSGSTTGFMVQQNCDPLAVIMRKSVYNLRHRLLSSDNVIVCNIVGSSFFVDSQITKVWTNLLYMS